MEGRPHLFSVHFFNGQSFADESGNILCYFFRGIIGHVGSHGCNNLIASPASTNITKTHLPLLEEGPTSDAAAETD